MDSEIFGQLDFEYNWTRDYQLRIFGKTEAVKLVIPGGEDTPIEPAQEQAFIRFEQNKEAMTAIAERMIFDHYLDILEDYRARFGSEADRLAPRVQTLDQLASLVQPTEVLIQESFGAPDRIVGLLFTCSWEPELGLAVKFVNETAVEVGTQDIVL